MSSAPRFCLAGATATGKSAVAQYLAERMDAVVLSADAMLVYQMLDIGTAKPSLAERGDVPYFGVDCVTPAEDFSAAAWLAEAARAEASARPCIVAGGTGLYFSALLRGLDPSPPANPELRAALEQLPLEALQARLAATGNTIADPSNPRRLVRALEILESGGELPSGWQNKVKPPLTALTWDRAILHQRIARRVEEMYAAGLLAEAERARQAYPTWSRTAAQAIGYAEAFAVLDGTMTLAEAKERTVVRTRQLARRQEVYLRGQFDVTWVRGDPGDTLETLAEKVMHAWQS
jgi:tRNA dimethylallyltransferase